MMYRESMNSRERFLWVLVFVLATAVAGLTFVVILLLNSRPANAPIAGFNQPDQAPAAAAAHPTFTREATDITLPTPLPIPTRVPSPTPVTADGKVTERILSPQGYAITVNQVQESQGTDNFKARAGDTLLLLDLTVENSANSGIVAFDSPYFIIMDSNGNKYDSALTVATPELAAVLKRGDKKEGWLSFEVPANATGLELVYSSNAFSAPSEIRIDLGR
jgi:hypothetical protein